MKSLLRKIIRRFARIIQKLRIVYYSALSSGVRVQKSLLKIQPLLIAGEGSYAFIENHVTALVWVSIGNNSAFRSNSVVIDNIPDNVIATSLHCRVIKAF